MDIRDIAKRAKVSTATVSRVINRVPTVDPQLSRRVWAVVNQLGYFPNTQARALVSGKSRIFGLVVSEITNPFFPEIVQTFENLAAENGFEILLTSTSNDPRRMELAVRRMTERRVEGVAIMTFGMENSLLTTLKQRGVPLVFVDGGPLRAGVTSIRVDFDHGIRQAVQHLAALRHTRIAFVSGPLHLESALARKAAFQLALGEIGLPVLPELMVEGDHRVEGGVEAFRSLAALAERPTAVVCSNDMTAIGVMREAFEWQLTVPRDLSVIGFDDIHLAQYMIPPLTTVQMSQAELARLAFTALMEERESAVAEPRGREVHLVTSLVLRKSTALAPAAFQPRVNRRKSGIPKSAYGSS